MESGDFRIEIGRSSRDIACCAGVRVESTVALPRHYDLDSIFMDILADPHAKAAVKPLLDNFAAMFMPEDADRSDAAQEAISDEMNLAMLNYMPLRAMLSFAGDQADPAMLDEILTALNS